MGEKKQFTCQNLSCKTTFTTPLKTLNLQEKPTEPYFACPFCLTKIENLPIKNQQREATKQNEEAKEAKSGQQSKKPVESNAACRFHLGYLSERTNKEQIPDDCLVCKDIVDCMLKKMQE